MLTHYKHFELDLQKIVKYSLDYNGDYLFENFIHYFWRHSTSNFVHFSSMYIVMVDRDRINFMQKFLKMLRFIVIYFL